MLLERVRDARVDVLPFLHHALRGGHRERPLRRDRLADGQRALEQLLGREHAVHETDAQRLLGRHRRAAEHQLLRAREADPARQPARAAEAGDDAEVHLGLTEARLRGRVDPVAGAGQLAAAAERVAVHGRDARHGQRFERREDAVSERLKPSASAGVMPRIYLKVRARCVSASVPSCSRSML